MEDPSRSLEESYNMVIQQMTVDDNAYVATFPTKDRFASCYNSTIRRINPPIPDDLDELDIPAPFNEFRGQAFVLHKEHLSLMIVGLTMISKDGMIS